MPRYDFVCPNCHCTFERQVAGSCYVVPCPHCEYVARRQPCAPAFTVKGFSAKNNYAGTDKQDREGHE